MLANRLLDRLPADERGLVAARVQEFDMDAGDVLCHDARRAARVRDR
jgi:hypothetical protein